MAETGPSAVVAVATLAADDALADCLDSLARQTYKNFDLVVVDNSGCGLVQRSGQARKAGARVIEMPANVGFGAAINRAWQGSDVAYLATLNDDAAAAPEWLGALIAAAEAEPKAGMFASRVTLAGSSWLDSAGMLLCADGSSKQRGHGQPASAFDRREDVLLPSGAAALYRGAMLRTIGVFDADFFLYCEDTDLGLRAQRAGWRCVYVPEAVVSHRYSHSAGRVSALKAYYVERNRLFLVVKNFPVLMLLAAPAAALVRYFWHVLFLLRGTGAAAQFASESGAGLRLPWMVLQAHLALLKHLPRLLHQRAAIHRQALLSPRDFRRLLRRFRITPRTVAQY